MSDVPGASALKRVPKWAWIASAGVTGGVIYMRRKQGQQVDMSAPSDATSAGDYGQSTFPASGVVTGPAMPSGEVGGSSTDLAGIVGAIGGVYSDAAAQAQVGREASDSQQWGVIHSLIDALPGYAGAGGAPLCLPSGWSSSCGCGSPCPGSRSYGYCEPSSDCTVQCSISAPGSRGAVLL